MVNHHVSNHSLKQQLLHYFNPSLILIDLYFNQRLRHLQKCHFFRCFKFINFCEVTGLNVFIRILYLRCFLACFKLIHVLMAYFMELLIQFFKHSRYFPASITMENHHPTLPTSFNCTYFLLMAFLSFGLNGWIILLLS